MRPGIALNDPDDDAAALLTPLGEYMQRRNAELGLSVSAVAQRVGMSRATWYRIARGESASPGVRVLRGLARVYRVRAAELFALAAHADPSPSASRPQGTNPGREPGDALWRCRHERRVRPGSWLDVHLELRNLSDQPWRHAEVRGLHDTWLVLGESDPRAQRACGEGRGLSSCRARLAPTGPGEWVQAQITLRAPLAFGSCIFCLHLYTEPSMGPVGAGVFLVMETA